MNTQVGDGFPGRGGHLCHHRRDRRGRPGPRSHAGPIDPYPSGTFQGTINVPGGDLVWKGKTFNRGTVYDNFAFPSPFP
ncbi:hypothetical protein [Rhodococcus koreensis]